MIIIIFVLGLIVGSFLNAVIHRLHTGQSIFETHSRCPHCLHKLGFRDLIPGLSFFVLRGRCRYCGGKISWQYPLVEFSTAIAFVLIYINSVIPAEAGIQGMATVDWILIFIRMTFASLLILIFVYDLKHYLILDKVVFPAAALALIYQGYQGNLSAALLGAGLLAGFFWLLYLVSSGRWIGAGDIKLGIFLGVLVPWPQTLVLFFLAYLLGAIVAVGLLIAGRKKIGDRLPFGTFLTLAAFLAMIWGEEIIGWYFHLIGIY